MATYAPAANVSFMDQIDDEEVLTVLRKLRSRGKNAEGNNFQGLELQRAITEDTKYSTEDDVSEEVYEIRVQTPLSPSSPSTLRSFDSSTQSELALANRDKYQRLTPRVSSTKKDVDSEEDGYDWTLEKEPDLPPRKLKGKVILDPTSGKPNLRRIDTSYLKKKDQSKKSVESSFEPAPHFGIFCSAGDLFSCGMAPPNYHPTTTAGQHKTQRSARSRSQRRRHDDRRTPDSDGTRRSSRSMSMPDMPTASRPESRSRAKHHEEASAQYSYFGRASIETETATDIGTDVGTEMGSDVSEYTEYVNRDFARRSGRLPLAPPIANCVASSSLATLLWDRLVRIYDVDDDEETAYTDADESAATMPSVAAASTQSSSSVTPSQQDQRRLHV